MSDVKIYPAREINNFSVSVYSNKPTFLAGCCTVVRHFCLTQKVFFQRSHT